MIKLPFVIGTKEFEKHPFAGTVFMGNLDEDLEQVQLYNAEKEAIADDKKAEQQRIADANQNAQNQQQALQNQENRELDELKDDVKQEFAK